MKSSSLNMWSLAVPASILVAGLSILYTHNQVSDAATQSPIKWTDTPWTLGLASVGVGKAIIKPGTYSYRCPSGGTIGKVVGSGPYGGESSVCSAAIHAGFIGTSGGSITIKVPPAGVVNYTGSPRNGITSESFRNENPTYDVSFEFVGTAPPASCSSFTLGTVINDVWIAAGGEKGRLGCPIMNEAEARPSSFGTTGRFAEFNGGEGVYVILHSTGKLKGTAFDVNGCIFKLYRNAGGTASVLGFPIGNAFETPTGSRQDFEGGFVAWNKTTFQCQAHAYGPATTTPTPTPPPVETKYEWVNAGPGDCTGSDTGSSDGSAIPDVNACNASRLNTVAVCWDGSQYRHPSKGSPWCTYKSTEANPCRRPGANFGMTYVCRSASPTSSTTSSLREGFSIVDGVMYANINASLTPTTESCRDTCAKESRCKAYTFEKARPVPRNDGLKTFTYPYCKLFEQMGRFIPDEYATSGLKGQLFDLDTSTRTPALLGGGWDTGGAWGILTMTQNGNNVTGNYTCCGRGTVQGTASGEHLRFTWTRSDGAGGEAFLDIKQDNSIEGKWCFGRGCDPTKGSNFTGKKRQ